MAADKYTIVWLCALTDELVVAKSMLDRQHDSTLCETPEDSNKYSLGSIGKHNIVICCLPEGIYGTDSASSTLTSLRRTFRNVRIGLLVGIGGAVFNPRYDIRVGDVAVSVPGNGLGGVLQYDFGKQLDDRFLLTRSLNKPPAVLLSAVGNLAARHSIDGKNSIRETLEKMVCDNPALRDWGLVSCAEEVLNGGGTQQEHKVPFERRPRGNPRVHYGAIASGNRVIRDPAMRDWLAQIPDVICVEMEAAGVMDILPCLVIRGISDCADSSKGDQWKRYAAGTAAAYAKELLGEVPQQSVAISTQSAPGADNYRIPLDLAQVPVGRSFIGRESELAYLRSHLLPTTSTDQKVVVLHGLAGIGKTQLAIRFAIAHKNDYSAIIWVNAKTRETLYQSLAAALPKLPTFGVQSDAHQIEQQARAVITWLSREGNSKFLLIYDNVEQPTVVEGPGTTRDCIDQISDYLPFACHGSIIITTRNMDLARRVRLGELYHVKRLDPDTSLQLLIGSDGTRLEPQDQTKLDFITLANRLGGLPLALVIARAFMQTSNTTPAGLLEMYSKSKDWSTINQETEPDSQYTNGTLISTLGMSYEEVKRRRPAAAKLLLLLSYYDNRDIWYTMIRNGTEGQEPAWLFEILSNEVKFRLTVAELMNFGLIEAAESGSYSMHPVVQDWCRHQRQVEDTEDTLSHSNIGDSELLALRSIARSIPSEDHPDAWEMQRRLLPHASQVIKSLKSRKIESNGLDPDPVLSLASLIPLCHRQEDEETLRELALVLVKYVVRILGPSHTHTISVLVLLGCLHLKTKKYLAELALKKAFNGSRDNPSDNCFAAQALAIFYITHKAWDDAEGLLLGTLHNLAGESHVEKPEIQMLGLCLGYLYAATGRFTEMEALFLKMAFDEQGALRPHMECLIMTTSLAALYAKRRQHDEAEHLYHQAIQWSAVHLGPTAHLTLRTTNDLGRHYWTAKRHEDAVRVLQNLLGIYEKLHGVDSTNALNTKMWLAFSHVALQRRDARELLAQVAEGYMRVLGPESAKTLDVLLNVGYHFVLLKCFSEAESAFRAAHTGYVKTMGWDHAATVESAVALAGACRADNRVDEAVDILEKARDNQPIAALSASTPDTRTMFLTAKLLDVQGKATEARIAYRDYLEASRRTPGARDMFRGHAKISYENLSSQLGLDAAENSDQ
ncbi:hypothetical protein BJY01DRAFT_214976 [Aspergillus pseudoustus]|uniref:AAA+ ATPase domain-containing protein n=1 Tax=Aspergillus pseudoustus TaxID=1810923 RepID=A0ABR4JWC3_9EURO